MKKTGEYIRKIINSNFPAYIFLFILTAALIIDTAMIAVSIAAYAISGNAANLENITTYALIISFASTVNVYLIKKTKMIFSIFITKISDVRQKTEILVILKNLQKILLKTA